MLGTRRTSSARHTAHSTTDSLGGAVRCSLRRRFGRRAANKKQRVGFSLVKTRAMQKKNRIPRLGQKQIKKISGVVEEVSGLTGGGAYLFAHRHKFQFVTIFFHVRKFFQNNAKFRADNKFPFWKNLKAK